MYYILYYIYIYIHSSLVTPPKKVSRYQAAFDGDVVRLADILEARYPQALVVIYIEHALCDQGCFGSQGGSHIECCLSLYPLVNKIAIENGHL